jgi:hypothetical protein
MGGAREESPLKLGDAPRTDSDDSCIVAAMEGFMGLSGLVFQEQSWKGLRL